MSNINDTPKIKQSDRFIYTQAQLDELYELAKIRSGLVSLKDASKIKTKIRDGKTTIRDIVKERDKLLKRLESMPIYANTRVLIYMNNRFNLRRFVILTQKVAQDESSLTKRENIELFHLKNAYRIYVQRKKARQLLKSINNINVVFFEWYINKTVTNINTKKATEYSPQ